MTDIMERLKAEAERDGSDRELLEDAAREIFELRERRDALEEILIVLARTPLPWDDLGNPTESMPHFRERYLKAMYVVSEMLGLNVRSTITRTEPRT